MVKNRKKLVLVTGGAGFIGSHLCERLFRDGYSVVSLDDYSTGVEDNHIPGVEYRRGHTKDIAMLVSEVPDLVFHLGEYARVEQSFGDIEKLLESNVVGSKEVFEFCRKRGVRIIYAGSSTKYAHPGIGREQSPYAWTKAMNTEWVYNYGEWFNLSYAITYFYNVYGPRERIDEQSGTVIGIFADKMRRNLPLPVRSPGTQKRNFTHVYDIVEALVLIGEKGSGDGYGIGHPDAYSIIEVAEMFGGVIEKSPERSGNRESSNFDTRRTRLELGWKPRYSLPDYINSVL